MCFPVRSADVVSKSAAQLISFACFENRTASQVHAVHYKMYGHLCLRKVVKNSVVF